MAEQKQSHLDALAEVRKRRLLIDRCDACLFDHIRPFLGRRVLEVGCGHGNLIEHLQDRDLVMAVDIDPTSVDLVRRRFSGCPNVVTQVSDITSQAVLELKQYQFDTVVSLNTIEHIEDDGAALRHIAQLLAPPGLAIIVVPAFRSLYGTMDESIGHYRRYSRPMLAEKLEASGLQVQKQYYFNLLGIIGWFLNGRILRRRVPPSSQLRLYNLVFPVVTRVEALIPPVVGLSLVSISRRSPVLLKP